MKILITGGLGHIGSYVTKKIFKIKKVKKIYLLDNISNKRFNVLFEINKKKIKFIYGDLKNDSILKKIPKTNIVLHLASITNSEESYKIEKKIFENNFGSFKNIVKYCLKYDTKLIHISSTSVYGSKNGLVDENNVPDPQSPYSRIKLKEENFLKNKKIKYISLRFGTISGFSTGMRFHTAVNKFCFNTVLKLPIPIWGSALNTYRPYLSLSDAFKVIKYIIFKDFFPCDIFNIFSENKTVKEILALIKKNNFKPKIKFTKSRAPNNSSFLTSKQKFEKKGPKLNYKISKDIKDTLNKLRNIY